MPEPHPVAPVGILNAESLISQFRREATSPGFPVRQVVFPCQSSDLRLCGIPFLCCAQKHALALICTHKIIRTANTTRFRAGHQIVWLKS